jgi:hypothetical protein
LIVAAVRIVAVAAIVFGLSMWVQTLRQAGDDPSILDRDWVAFHRAGKLMVSGDWLEIYPGSFDGHYPFPYPPFFMYVCAPLGVLPPWGAYAACVIGATVAMLAALRVLRGWLPGQPGQWVTAGLAALASAPWLGIVVVGQFCSWYVLALATAFASWQRGRMITAGLLLSLLMAKPNIGLIVAVAAVAMGGVRVAAGVVIGLVVLVASSLPLGLDMWPDYVDASVRMTELTSGSSMELWKHQTLFAFWSTVFGPTASIGWVRLVWIISLLPMAVGAFALWRRRRSADQLPRILSVIVLGLVACNPYIYFYDGLLLMLPGVIWYVRRDSYAVPWCHRAAGLCLLFIYAWQHLSLFVLKAEGHLALTGVGVYVWFMLEVYDLVRGGRTVRIEADDAKPRPAPAAKA